MYLLKLSYLQNKHTRLFWRSIMLNIYCFYGLLISLKQNFLSLYEYLYRDFNRALFTNSMIEHLSVFEKVDVDWNRILLPPTLHISNFRELSILHLDLIVFFLNWSTRSRVYFRFYLSSSMSSLSLSLKKFMDFDISESNEEQRNSNEVANNSSKASNKWSKIMNLILK